MKKVSQFLNEVDVYHDRVPVYGTQTNNLITKYTSKGMKYVGMIGDKGDRDEMLLFELSNKDKSEYKSVKVPSGANIYRYVTNTSDKGGLTPVVAVNLAKGIVYFNKEVASQEDRVEFERKGMKMRFVRFLDGKKA